MIDFFFMTMTKLMMAMITSDLAWDVYLIAVAVSRECEADS